MKIYSIVFLFLLVISAYSQEKFQIRNGITWGMSPAQVQELETAEFYTTYEGNLIYLDKVAGFDCRIWFNFKASELISISYFFQQEHTNKNDFIEDFAKIKEGLTTKYGEPFNSIIDWKAETFRDMPDMWGLAVSAGELEYKSGWRYQGDGTEIVLSLTGDNYEITLAAAYFQPDFSSSPNIDGL